MATRLFYLFSIVFFMQLHTATARPGGLSGRITDDAGKPLPLVSVLLLSGDSVLVKTELTDEKGEYHLTPVADGKYSIKVMLNGYEVYTKPDVTIAGANMPQPDIALQHKGAQLGEVAIRAQKPLVEVHADKLVVNVENSIVNTGSSALEVLARSPGVTIDNNDNISLKGKQGVNVMINGKIVPISGQDLANMLKSMPASSLENIELISNPSAKYDAAGTAGIINIKMKRDKKAGLNGSVNATYIQGVYGKATGGFNMNYRNKKFNLYATYNHSHRVGFNHLTLDRNFFVNDVFAGAYVQDNHYLYHIYSDMGSLGMDYNLSAKTIVGFALNGDYTNFRRDGYNYSDIVDSSTRQVLSHFTTRNSSPNKWHNYTANINLRHSFDSTGRSLGVDVDYATYPSKGIQDYTTEYFDDLRDGTKVPSTTIKPVIFHGDIKGLTQIRSFKADYTHPLNNSTKLEGGAKASYVTADNDLKFYNFNDVTRLFENDAKRTNHFIYKENINAAYVNLSKDWPKWSTQIGLRAEQTVATGDAVTIDSSFERNYTQLFPSFAVQRHINKDNDLGVTLSRRIERPNYEQLNPSSYYLDPTTFKAGYPYLNPALSYSAELSHVYKQRFVTSFNYTITSAPITEVIQPSPTEAKVTIQTQKNLTQTEFYAVNGSYQFAVTKWWNNTSNFGAFYAHYTGDIAGTNLSAGTVSFNVNMNNSFILPQNWSAELGGFYQAPQVYGYMNLKQEWMLNAGIQKNLFNKKATVRLNATDIFWKGFPRATSVYNDYRESFVARRDTRQVSLSFTYRFGQRSGPQQRHHGGAEEEQRRAGGQTG
ncbi:MAG: outer membrane beta-barrel protein [Bacteroidota bacterium]